MNLQRMGVAAVAALALAGSLALPARAQPVKPANDNENRVHRMEIWNGPVRATHYFTPGYSPGEDSALRDLARAESDLAVADEVQSLRRLYLRNEQALAQRRGQVNPLLYGYSSEYSAGLFPGVVTRGFGYGNFAGYPYLGGYGNGGGGFGYPGVSASIGTVANSLNFGVGSEGVMKDVLAPTVAQAATPEALARATRAYDTALVRLASYPKTFVGVLGLQNVPVGNDKFTLPDGKQIEGSQVYESSDNVFVRTTDGKIVLIPKKTANNPRTEMKPEKP